MESTVTENRGLCAIEIGPNGIAFAQLSSPGGFEIVACEFFPYQFSNQFSGNHFEEQLAQISNKYHLKKAQCNVVLHPNHYRLTLTSAPNVPQAEYKKAIRWQIKDLISYNLEDTTVDIFYPDEPEKTLKKIYVIAVQTSLLQNIIKSMQNCGLVPAAIDIREFAVRNLIANLAKPNEIIGFLCIDGENCLMITVKQNNVQFVRRFTVNLQSLRNGNYNDLVTEIQRSFSYCQTELKQELPNRLLVPSEACFDKNIIQTISQSINKEMTMFSFKDIVSFKTPIDPATEAKCGVAIGGALRNTIVRTQ